MDDLDQPVVTAHAQRSRDSISPSTTPPLSSPETAITEPEQSPGEDDDIWDTSSDHDHVPLAASQISTLPSHPQSHDHESDGHPIFQRGDILSDLPAIRRQHMTDGYREGLSVGKARVMQSGFDAGYLLGVEVGLRAGNVLGVLEGVLGALTSVKVRDGSGKGRRTDTSPHLGAAVASTNPEAKFGVDTERGQAQGATQAAQTREQEGLKFVRTMYVRAQEELKISKLLKGLDDEKVAAIQDAIASDGGAENDNDQGKAVTSKEILLPEDIENVLGKWERLVLGALGANEHDRIKHQDFGHTT